MDKAAPIQPITAAHVSNRDCGEPIRKIHVRISDINQPTRCRHALPAAALRRMANCMAAAAGAACAVLDPGLSRVCFFNQFDPWIFLFKLVHCFILCFVTPFFFC
jgi:hypothetical protein